ncbi:hypothetical protein [Halocella sp. SP3-1]|uniref:hypothetical protein n=1 Tax=Halocella sp. SP3-1 TaxID=2382161 RepID=UPI000F762E6D|nr:hypothetical protein [Halocella sp. SP3-1]AZO93786.1 hypothetical protein D7D81_03805 [Halocella sp. SP3-1]
MNDYSIAEAPQFVDQVYPDWIAKDYNYYFGRYKYGFWANLLENKGDLHEPTEWGAEDRVVGVFGQDNQMYWFTDHTTLNKSDTSMVGYSMNEFKNRSFNILYWCKWIQKW